AMRTRLATVLPAIVWNFDDRQLGYVLDAELQRPDLVQIAVYAGDDLLASRLGQGTIAGAGPLQTLPLQFEGRAVGEVRYQLSTERIDARLSKLVQRKAVEIALLAGILVAVLIRTFNSIVLKPLAALRAALDRSANQRSFSLEELAPMLRQQDEFAELSQSVARITQRLTSELEERKLAEEAIRRAKQNVDEAYTQLQATQTSLVQAEKMASLGGLVAGVAHEINTPVGVIVTSASVLDEETQHLQAQLDAGAVKKSVLLAYCEHATDSARLILGNAERAAELIQSFKRVAVDQTSEAHRDYELRQYLHEIVTSLTPSLKRRPIHITVDCQAAVMMDGYPGALSQVLTNLLTNVLAHAFHGDEEGDVLIVAQCDGDVVTLTLSDNGRGIAPEHLPKVFDPFFTTRRGQGGSGLGLHLVYNLVTQTLGGNIVVRSEPGAGTTFFISLPRQAPQH
ncbi:MAG TPA: HAMP domain-containing sensor histidine kinase, partial [Chitinolyticbacter sp.]|nr:HAMP domain-containing sensor histidine kinase [Chitinolyticbacter sp.]